MLLVSVVRGLWIEHASEEIGPPLVHSGGRDRAASALNEAVAQLAEVPGMGHVEQRLEVSSSPARGLHDAAVAEQADLAVVGSSHLGRVGHVLLGSVAERHAPCPVLVTPRVGETAG